VAVVEQVVPTAVEQVDWALVVAFLKKHLRYWPGMLLPWPWAAVVGVGAVTH
jgi:hypothetical protein